MAMESPAIINDVMTNYVNSVGRFVANMPDFATLNFQQFVAANPEGLAAPMQASEAARAEAARRNAAPAAPVDANEEARIQQEQDALFRGGLDQRGGTRAAVKPIVFRALGVPLGSAMAVVLGEIMNGGLVLSRKGKLIYNVPKSDEMLSRLVTPLFIKSKGLDVTAAGIPTTVASEIYKEMPASDRNTYVALMNMSPEQKAAWDRWDERVDLIRDALSVNISTGAGGIPPQNMLQIPVMNSVSVYSNYPPTVQAALKERRSDPTKYDTTGVLRKLGTISLSMRGGGQKGGNAHAPLYPAMVMNGGAHPFATFSGGDVDPVQVLLNKIAALKVQFQQASGKALDPALAGQIDGYAATIKAEIKKVQDSLNTLQSANAALAQYPLGLGVDIPTTLPEMKDIAKQSEELNKAAERASKKMDKLSEIKSLLEDLVSKVNPVVLNK